MMTTNTHDQYCVLFGKITKFEVNEAYTSGNILKCSTLSTTTFDEACLGSNMKLHGDLVNYPENVPTIDHCEKKCKQTSSCKFVF